MNIKILLAEDHEHTRKTLAYGLKMLGNIDFVAEVENGLDAVKYANQHKPDLILMDIVMPVLNGIEATRVIKKDNPEIKVIVLTSMGEKENVLSAFNSGANAYCLKNIKINDLLNVIKTVMDGAIWIDPAIAGYVMEILQSGKTSSCGNNNCICNDFSLTNREKEILKLISEGLSNKSIAEKLFLSVHTVKNHVKSVIQKLYVDDRTQAAILAIKEKII